ncbi:MAG: cation:proton antiporter [Theionarchaea archaeon]|nr:cation:proton antiporter [Theionarchaea archaeon]MBU7000267.1 cation:proton antiporter [Theionarchaea archaeon]MBU7022068.1 cation:proton antiporter [Theionarchaea archaeon]MBU7034750.1 cation:proton antiporter [Theionarchaea archaeon]MBU7040463.1 cation:proton antiporter [Theionarchaea archaeon]
MASPVLLVAIQMVIMVLVATSVICFVRVLVGPTISDRMVGLNTISTKVTLMLVLLSILYGRALLLDVAIGFAMLNVTGSLVVAKYMEGGFRD